MQTIIKKDLLIKIISFYLQFGKSEFIVPDFFVFNISQMGPNVNSGVSRKNIKFGLVTSKCNRIKALHSLAHLFKPLG